MQSSEELAESLRFAFERENAVVTVLTPDEASDVIAELLAVDAADDTGEGHDVIIVSAATEIAATGLLARLRSLVRESSTDTPILYLGNEVGYHDGVRAGANAVLHQPLFLRDVVVTASLLASRKRPNLVRGELRGIGGMFPLTRALTQIGRSAVLTAVRGLRRGEIRFFEGEVTSSQVGMLHGIAALHHLMLWQVGTFELRFESVVRRQQIPMKTAELMADVHRFLAEIHEASMHLELYGAYETLPEQIAGVAMPDEIREVLDLMDGSRTVADMVEDSPFRMFDTLRIADRLAELGMVKHLEEVSSDFGFKLRRRQPAAGSSVPQAVEHEETGKATRPLRAHVERALSQESEESAPTPTAAPREIDWSNVMPTLLTADDKLAQVVPAAVAAGEITVSGASEEPDDTAATHADATPKDAAPKDVTPAAPKDVASDSPSGQRPLPEKLETFTNAEERDELFALGDALANPSPSEAIGEDPASQPDADQASEPDADGTEGEDEGKDEGEGNDDTEAATPDKTAKAGNPGFSDDEEEFFREGVRSEKIKPPPVESFDDLDADYQPTSFWQRLFGRGKRRRPATVKARRGDAVAHVENASTTDAQAKKTSVSEAAPDAEKATAAKATAAKATAVKATAETATAAKATAAKATAEKATAATPAAATPAAAEPAAATPTAEKSQATSGQEQPGSKKSGSKKSGSKKSGSKKSGSKKSGSKKSGPKKSGPKKSG